MRGATILFTEMSPDIDWEDDFNRWYDTHHIPNRTKVEGFISAHRYRDPDRPAYLAIYEIASEEVLYSSDYEKVRAQPNAQTAWMLSNVENYSRYIGNEINDSRQTGVDEKAIDEAFVFAEFYSVPDDKSDEFNRWYDEEYSPLVLKCPEWKAVRRFEIIEGDPQPWTHLALHYLSNAVTALSSKELQESRKTDRRLKLEQEYWFQGSSQFYEAIGDRFKA